MFNKLKADFSACLLPYSQALDVSRTYLGRSAAAGSRRCGPSAGTSPSSCSIPRTSRPGSSPGCGATRCAPTSPSSTSASRRRSTRPCSRGDRRPRRGSLARWSGIVGLPAFLAETCLSYCEFYELWQSGFVAFRNGADRGETARSPSASRAARSELWLQFPAEQQEHDLAELRCSSGCGASCASPAAAATPSRELRDICDVLQLQAERRGQPGLHPPARRVPDAARRLPAGPGRPRRPGAPGAVDADRTHLLALWADPARGPVALGGAAADHAGRAARAAAARLRAAIPEFVKLLAGNLDPLSRLAGFDPGSADRLLARAADAHAAVRRGAGQDLRLRLQRRRADLPVHRRPAPRRRRPVPAAGRATRRWTPRSGCPTTSPDHALWRLRRELLRGQPRMTARKTDEEARGGRVAVAADRVRPAGGVRVRGGRHHRRSASTSSPACWPGPARPAARRRRGSSTGLAAASTSAPMWNNPPDGPLHYDPAAEQLSARLPLTDRAVIAKLTAGPRPERGRAAGGAGPVLPAPRPAGPVRAAVRRLRRGPARA